MFKIFANVTNNRDGTDELKKALKELAGKDILIGIPQEDSSRTPTLKGSITNAELAYIHTHGIRKRSMRKEMQPNIDSGMPYSKAYKMYIQSHGSPIWQSPPRPIIEPAIENDKENLSDMLKVAARLALDGDIEGAERQMNITGMQGQNDARAWFTNGKNNWPENAESTIKKKGSSKPLINTGELRKSITWVIRKK